MTTQLTVDEQRPVEITPCHDGGGRGSSGERPLVVASLAPVDVPPMESGPLLVQETLAPLSITPTSMKPRVGERSRLLVKEDQGTVTVPR